MHSCIVLGVAYLSSCAQSEWKVHVFSPCGRLPVSADRRSTSSPAACKQKNSASECVGAAHILLRQGMLQLRVSQSWQAGMRTLCVNVMTSIEEGRSPCCNVCATRAATTRVLPLPGPADRQVASTGRGQASAGMLLGHCHQCRVCKRWEVTPTTAHRLYTILTEVKQSIQGSAWWLLLRFTCNHTYMLLLCQHRCPLFRTQTTQKLGFCCNCWCSHACTDAPDAYAAVQTWCIWHPAAY